MSSWGNIFHLLRFHAKIYGNGNESGYRKSTVLQPFIYKNAPTDNGTELHKKKEHTKKELTLECLIAKKMFVSQSGGIFASSMSFSTKKIEIPKVSKTAFS